MNRITCSTIVGAVVFGLFLPACWAQEPALSRETRAPLRRDVPLWIPLSAAPLVASDTSSDADEQAEVRSGQTSSPKQASEDEWSWFSDAREEATSRRMRYLPSIDSPDSTTRRSQDEAAELLPRETTESLEPGQEDDRLSKLYRALSEVDDDMENEAEGDTADGTPTNDQRQGFDQGVVRQGQGLFEASCTQCHDTDRSTAKRKSLAGWRATIRRMAAKEGADIPRDEHVPIATYLASLNPAAHEQDGGAADVPSLSIHGTISPVWRGSDTDLENKGFFPDIWVGLEWQPQESPLSGRVTTCTSCHGSNRGLGVELVEAAFTLDLAHVVTGCSKEQREGCLEAELKAGRFIVPFGAFSSMVHPGAIRTVSNPLMFNMGRRVGSTSPRQPVLDMPYSDEGANLHLSQPLGREGSATFDFYGVNGLQTGGPSVFFSSRSYRDNNTNVAAGGRATIGNGLVRFGGSASTGELQAEGGNLQTYQLFGGDATFTWNDRLRVYYEYAIRDENCFPGSECLSYGNVAQAELKIWDSPCEAAISKIGLLGRYDTLVNRGTLGDTETERYTWGFNFTLRGGSLLILNHEHWKYSDREEVNIAAVRWTAVF